MLAWQQPVVCELHIAWVDNEALGFACHALPNAKDKVVHVGEPIKLK